MSYNRVLLKSDESEARDRFEITKSTLLGPITSTWRRFSRLNTLTLLYVYLPGVLKTGFPEVLSRIQLIAGNLSGHNLLKAVTFLG